MVAIRKLEEIVKKWQDVTPTRAPQYEYGVKNPLKDWATNAAAAENAWESGVQDAITNKRFAAGVKKAGTTKWQEMAVKKGARRFSEGVSIAGPAYAAGFGPYRDALEKLALPPRGPKGDPKNLERVRVIADTLHKLKVGKA